MIVLFASYSCVDSKKESVENTVRTAPESTVVDQQTIKDLHMDQMNTLVYSTAHKSDQKLSLIDTLEFGKWIQPREVDAAITVDVNSSFQELLGIGAALTDAAAETFYKLSDANQKRFLEAYYDRDKGIGYSLGRTIIHSCDFSPYSYTYIEEGDKELNTFDIEHDREFRIPFTKAAIEAAGGRLTVYASPWSPPAFMKTNGSMLQGGSLLPEYRNSWAMYYARFIKEYEKEGIPIWGLTVQNEPMAVQRWESCIYTAEEERDFLKNHLGPTLEKEGLGDKNIIVWDHNRDLLFQRASTILNDPEAAKYVWGTGFHWYEDWKDGVPMYEAVSHVNESFPDKKLIFTEGCNENYDLLRLENEDPKLAERYGNSMINDFNNGTVAWTDWNILLNQNGGPNHVGNLCFAPVHGDTTTDELNFTNSYYYIGHFSKFIRPGARRMSSVSSTNNLLTTAFKNRDGSLAIVVLNHSDLTIDYSLSMMDKTSKLSMLPHSIQTIVVK